MDESRIRPPLATQTPLTGRFERIVEAGFEILLTDGSRAFCPMSQVDTGKIDDAQAWLGRESCFLISHAKRSDEYPDGGQVQAVSRKAWLQRELEEKRAKLAKTLKVGDLVQGRISKVLPYGSFVDIGGFDTLVPVQDGDVPGTEVWVVIDDVKTGEGDSLCILPSTIVTLRMVKAHRSNPDQVPQP